MSAYQHVQARNPNLLEIDRRFPSFSLTTPENSSLPAEPHDQRILRALVDERIVMNSKLFKEVVIREGKRSRLSGSASLLMTVRLAAAVVQAERESGSLSGMLKAMLETIRQTDIVGWYDDRLTVGLLLTEISGAKDVVATAILKRLREAVGDRHPLLEFSVSRQFHDYESFENYESLTLNAGGYPNQRI